MFEPGKSGNPSGRAKGQKNKLSVEVRQALRDLVEEQIPTLKADLGALEPAERVRLLVKLLDFVVPRLRSVDFAQPVAADHCGEDLDNEIERLLSMYEGVQGVGDAA